MAMRSISPESRRSFVCNQAAHVPGDALKKKTKKEEGTAREGAAPLRRHRPRASHSPRAPLAQETTMWSSPLHLSLASVFALIGFTLVGIALLSDYWTEFQVNRREIVNAFNREPELNARLKEAFARNPLYFSRNYGIFHICFPDAVPQEIGSYTKWSSPCITNNDYLPDDTTQDAYSNAQLQRLYFMRGSAVLLLLGFALVCLFMIIGIVACWKRSSRLIGASGVLLLFAVLFLAGGMATWHYVSYLERYVLDQPTFYRGWEPVLKSTTRFNYGWSYIVAWVGIAFLFFASAFMFFSYHTIKKEADKEFEAKHAAYMMPSYYDKSAMVPYGYGTYGGGYGGYPGAYYNSYAGNGYYGYMTYGR